MKKLVLFMLLLAGCRAQVTETATGVVREMKTVWPNDKAIIDTDDGRRISATARTDTIVGDRVEIEKRLSWEVTRSVVQPRDQP